MSLFHETFLNWTQLDPTGPKLDPIEPKLDPIEPKLDTTGHHWTPLDTTGSKCGPQGWQEMVEKVVKKVVHFRSIS